MTTAEIMIKRLRLADEMDEIEKRYGGHPPINGPDHDLWMAKLNECRELANKVKLKPLAYETDWQGRPIANLINPESPDSIIPIWVITISEPDEIPDEVWIRSYQQMTRYVDEAFADKIDGADEETLRAGISMTVKLRDVRLVDYLETQQAEEV